MQCQSLRPHPTSRSVTDSVATPARRCIITKMFIRQFVIFLCLALAYAGTAPPCIDNLDNQSEADEIQAPDRGEQDGCEASKAEGPCQEEESDEPGDFVARNPGLVDPVQRTLRTSLARKSLVWPRTHRSLKPPQPNPRRGWFSGRPTQRLRPVTRMAVLALPIQCHAPPAVA